MFRIIRLTAYKLFKFPVYKILLGKIGPYTRLVNTRIEGYSRIFIGTKVYINDRGWLACHTLTGDKEAKIIIGNGTYIGRFCHIYATSKIEIGTKVLMSDKVYISDNMHNYENIEVAVLDQPIKQAAQVVISDGAWLGENVCVIGASVGKNSVVGANSIVTKNIPDYCVAIGAPAIIIKRYNFDLKQWQKTDKAGNFI